MVEKEGVGVEEKKEETPQEDAPKTYSQEDIDRLTNQVNELKDVQRTVAKKDDQIRGLESDKVWRERIEAELRDVGDTNAAIRDFIESERGAETEETRKRTTYLEDRKNAREKTSPNAQWDIQAKIVGDDIQELLDDAEINVNDPRLKLADAEYKAGNFAEAKREVKKVIKEGKESPKKELTEEEKLAVVKEYNEKKGLNKFPNSEPSGSGSSDAEIQARYIANPDNKKNMDDMEMVRARRGR